MVEYTLLNRKIVFNDPALRFFELLSYLWEAQNTAGKKLSGWYAEKGGIERVLDDYEAFSEKVVTELMIQPLFEKLREYELYDLSLHQYTERCLNLSECCKSFQSVEASYEQILSEQERETYRRAARKAGRGRWVGGGFGLKGAIKGATQAAALNAVSGLGHSVVNAVGNAGSAAIASQSKSQLYSAQSTRECLFYGICEALRAAVNAHINILNEHTEGCIKNVFDAEKSGALFENAKIIKEKSEELLVEAVVFCPWNYQLLQYLFITYPTERKTVWTIAERFHVDLTAYVEKIIARVYTEEAKASEEEAQKAKADIFAIMREYRILESATLDQLEKDCIARLCTEVDIVDEATCEQMRERVNSYQALEKNKAPYLWKIQQRIDEIWTAEDKEAIESIYLKTDITSPDAIAAAKERILNKSRTKIASKYVEALDACNKKSIERAQKYYTKKSHLTLMVAAVALFIFSFVFSENFIMLQFAIVIAAAILFLKGRKIKSDWKKLTLDNTVIHPTLTKKLP